MTDSSPHNSTNNPASQRQRRPMLLLGSFMWVLCFIAIAFVWYQRRDRAVVAQTQPDSRVTAEEDEGRPKQLNLAPQADGSIALEERTKEQQENPWDPEGIEDFSFTNVDGQTVTKKDLIGKPSIFAFVFVECRGPCPNVTYQMRELQDRLKDFDFNLITLTVDPARDTSERLLVYGKNNGANLERWKFLTGNQADIYGLIHRSFKMPVKEAEGPDRQPGFEIIHSTNIMLVDKTGRVVGKYNAQKDDEMSKLRRDLKRIIKPEVDTDEVAAADAPVSKTENAINATEEPKRELPQWAAALPAVNAALNGLAGIMLIVGFLLIKQKLQTAHATAMIASFITSIVFLGCYLAYHYALHVYTGEPGKRFGHSGTLIGSTYRVILLTHVILAAAVPILASITLYRAWRKDWIRHRKIAVVTFPIWVYVSVTGVMIYVMLYHWPGAAP